MVPTDYGGISHPIKDGILYGVIIALTGPPETYLTHTAGTDEISFIGNLFFFYRYVKRNDLRKNPPGFSRFQFPPSPGRFPNNAGRKTNGRGARTFFFFFQLIERISFWVGGRGISLKKKRKHR